MNKKHKILFLYSHIAGYFINCVKTLKEIYPNTEIIFIYQDIDVNAPFQLNDFNFKIYSTKEFNTKSLADSCINFNPDIVYVAGWTNKQYLNIARIFKKQGKIIITGIDNPWTGTLRQHIGCLISPFFQEKYFSHVWVSGVSQYEFARRMGYSKNNILLGLYSADIDTFQKGSPNFAPNKKKKTLLYVGRFVPQKGLLLLCEVFRELCLDTNFQWELLLVGNGELKNDIPASENIVLKDFMQPNALISLIKDVDVFILPSTHEPWGVVVHEFAAAGLPIITSDSVNATSAFVKHGYNGYIFTANDKNSLKQTLLDLNKLSSEDFKKMGMRSRVLSLQNTPEIWAHTLIHLLN